MGAQSDELESVVVTPTSRASAIASDVILREGDRVRLLFRPQVVDNAREPRACINGTFLYQKRGKGEEWQDMRSGSLATLKKGEGYQLEVHSAELYRLMRALGPLYRRHWEGHGIPYARQKLVKLEWRLAELFALSQQDLNELLNANPEDAVKTLVGALRWAASSEAVSRMLQSEPERVPLIATALGVATLRDALDIWENNTTNDSEDFWQDTLDRRAFLLDQLFHYPIVLVRSKAYVGGKRIDNQHGNVADYLATATSTSGALLIEIKTPTTKLLAREYRQDVYPFSADVSGAISQVLHYRSSLQTHVNSLRSDGGRALVVDECKCMVIAGNIQAELDTQAKKQSFERLRERLHGVTVIGFDELFGRAAGLLNLLRASTDEPNP